MSLPIPRCAVTWQPTLADIFESAFDLKDTCLAPQNVDNSTLKPQSSILKHTLALEKQDDKQIE